MLNHMRINNKKRGRGGEENSVGPAGLGEDVRHCFCVRWEAMGDGTVTQLAEGEGMKRQRGT